MLSTQRHRKVTGAVDQVLGPRHFQTIPLQGVGEAFHVPDGRGAGLGEGGGEEHVTGVAGDVDGAGGDGTPAAASRR
jgi:hypothetical protein